MIRQTLHRWPSKSEPRPDQDMTKEESILISASRKVRFDLAVSNHKHAIQYDDYNTTCRRYVGGKLVIDVHSDTESSGEYSKRTELPKTPESNYTSARKRHLVNGRRAQTYDPDSSPLPNSSPFRKEKRRPRQRRRWTIPCKDRPPMEPIPEDSPIHHADQQNLRSPNKSRSAIKKAPARSKSADADLYIPVLPSSEQRWSSCTARHDSPSFPRAKVSAPPSLPRRLKSPVKSCRTPLATTARADISNLISLDV